MCLTIFQKENKAFLYYKKQKVKKSKNWHFSKGVTPWFWSKIWKFSIFFTIGKISQQNTFDNILERKKVFLDSKIGKYKKVEELGFFQRGLVYGFSQKFEIFFFLFLAKSNRKTCVKIFQEGKKLSQTLKSES